MPARHPYRQGDVGLVPLRYSGPAGEKDRPAIVLSTDSYHDEWDELLVVAVTSRPPLRKRPTDCALQDWKTAGLHQASWVRSHLVTVLRTRIIRRLGRLSQRDLAAVESCLHVATGL
jgi:mRNA-degrading endonuclease toxin of MazEF toxin-antitoxin module